MNRIIYDIFIFLYSKAISMASGINEKARLWAQGRKKLPLTGDHRPSIWMHCSSLGEFEQGRPVLEALKVKYPNYRFIVSFFSPSGYEIRKKYSGADFVCYLPIDTPKNAQKILEDWNPQLVLWVKYEYWFHFLSEINRKKIPLLLISAIFSNHQPFFKPWGGLWKKMLHYFSHIFLQTETSAELIADMISREKISVSGDTRFDRVLSLLENPVQLEQIATFIGQEKCLIAGSTWPDDEKLITYYHRNNPEIKIILAPHNISNKWLAQTKELFPGALLFSQLSAINDVTLAANRILIIDNIGMLSQLYRYATVTYVGGGFNRSGIHNTLEAAVYGKPVVFGPVYQKFEEAKLLIHQGGGFSISNEEELQQILQELLTDPVKVLTAGRQAAEMVKNNAGATQQIMSYIEGNRLLTN